MNTVRVSLSAEAFQGLRQRDTVGTRAKDGREFALDPRQFSDEELRALAEGDTVRKRDGATVLAIVVEGYEHARTVFEDILGTLAASGQGWALEPQEGCSAILFVSQGERYLVTVAEARKPALFDPETGIIACPYCEATSEDTDFEYNEDIAARRHMAGVEDGVVSFRGSDDYYDDDGENGRIVCNRCWSGSAIPDNMEIDWVS
jgi:hypothetical protein